jgi:hypothetical protein
MVWETDRDSRTTHEPASWPDVVDVQERSRTLVQIGAVRGGNANAEPRWCGAEADRNRGGDGGGPKVSIKDVPVRRVGSIPTRSRHFASLTLQFTLEW